MKVEFKTIKDLYEYIKPALNTKISELKTTGYEYICEEDIWNYLKEIKWKNAIDLSISEMVSDILNANVLLIDQYFKEKVKDSKRILYLEGEENEENRD